MVDDRYGAASFLPHLITVLEQWDVMIQYVTRQKSSEMDFFAFDMLKGWGTQLGIVSVIGLVLWPLFTLPLKLNSFRFEKNSSSLLFSDNFYQVALETGGILDIPVCLSGNPQSSCFGMLYVSLLSETEHSFFSGKNTGSGSGRSVEGIRCVSSLSFCNFREE